MKTTRRDLLRLGLLAAAAPKAMLAPVVPAALTWRIVPHDWKRFRCADYGPHVLVVTTWKWSTGA